MVGLGELKVYFSVDLKAVSETNSTPSKGLTANSLYHMFW